MNSNIFEVFLQWCLSEKLTFTMNNNYIQVVNEDGVTTRWDLLDDRSLNLDAFMYIPGYYRAAVILANESRMNK